MAERVRNRISHKNRERFVRAFEAPGQDYFVIAGNLDVNQSTAPGIIGRYLRKNRVGGRPRGWQNHVKVNEEMRRYLEAILNENCTVTLTAINAELQRRLPDKPYVSDRTILKHLEGMLFTLKLLHRVTAERNRQNVVECRHENAHWFLEEANLHHTVFIDKCGYNIWTAKSRGCLRRRDRAFGQVCGQKGRNVTICLAISPVLYRCHTPCYSNVWYDAIDPCVLLINQSF